MGVKMAICLDIVYIYNKNVLISLCCDRKYWHQKDNILKRNIVSEQKEDERIYHLVSET